MGGSRGPGGARGEPLLEVTAPIAEARLVETALLNEITFQTAVASKAARCRLAAGGADLVDFAFRRTQGTDAAMAGFIATSNVEAARRFGLAARHVPIDAYGVGTKVGSRPMLPTWTRHTSWSPTAGDR